MIKMDMQMIVKLDKSERIKWITLAKQNRRADSYLRAFWNSAT